MGVKCSKICFFFLAIMGVASVAFGQQNESPLEGYWKEVNASVYILVTKSDLGYSAEMIRNDWSPGLVGTIIFQNAVAANDKNDRWSGRVPIDGSAKTGKATLRINRSDELLSRLRPGGKKTWVRSEPVEKRR